MRIWIALGIRVPTMVERREHGRHLLGRRPCGAGRDGAHGLGADQAEQLVAGRRPAAASSGRRVLRATIRNVGRVERHADRRADRGAAGRQRQRLAVAGAVQVVGLVAGDGLAPPPSDPALGRRPRSRRRERARSSAGRPRGEDLLGAAVQERPGPRRRRRASGHQRASAVARIRELVDRASLGKPSSLQAKQPGRQDQAGS